MVQAIKQIGDGQGFKDLITALNKTITVPVNGKMVDYVIDPATYATLVGTVLSTRTQNIMKKAKAKITGKDIDETKGNEETIKGSEDNELDQEEDLEL